MSSLEDVFSTEKGGNKEWVKDKAAFGERVYVEKMIGLLNQLLFQLSQKHRVQIYLNQ